MKLLVIAAAVLVASTGATLAQSAEAGETVFKQCMACHDIGEDAKNKVGPELNGLDGRKSGTAEGYNSSTVIWLFVKTHISLAIIKASLAILAAGILVLRSNARAAASANAPPDPTARTPSSGSITSPVPERR